MKTYLQWDTHMDCPLSLCLVSRPSCQELQCYFSAHRKYTINLRLILSYHIYLLTPLGAGEANFDSYENNPFQNPKQRQEQEVQTLLQKLSHEMIGLDSSFVGTLDKGQ